MIVDEFRHKIYIKEAYNAEKKSARKSKILSDSDIETNKIKL